MTYNKLGLIMGLNYTGSTSALGGCINDAHNLRNLLVSDFSYSGDSITIMTDELSGSLYPNKQNIINQLEQLVNKVISDKITEVWISYSGHGSYTIDRNGDEEDNKDENICPLDFSQSGFITDDVIASYLARIPKTCRVVCIFDCCHSGTVCDLTYKYAYDKIAGKRKRVRKRVSRRVRRGRRYITRWVWRWVWENETDTWNWSGGEVNKNSKITCPIISISGCRDPQTSADVFNSEKNRWGGALTNAFINAVNGTDNSLSCRDLCQQLNKHMETNNLSQQPVLTTSYGLNSDHVFFRKALEDNCCIQT